KLRLLGYFFAGEAVGGVMKGAGGFGVVESANAARGEPVEEWGDDDLQIRTARPGNNADGVEGGGWLHAVAILPHGVASVEEILLVAFGAGEMAGADGENFQLEMGGCFADGGDGFLVQRGVSHDAAGGNVLAR